MNGDPLSDVIALSGARCTATRCMEVDGAFHFRFATPAGIKFVAVTHGFCWLAVEGMQPRALETGDVFMLRGDRRFAMASDLALPAIDGNGVFTADAPSDSSEPSGFQTIGGHVAIDRESGRMLVDLLPPVIMVDRQSSAALGTDRLLQELVRERTGERTGFVLALQQLTQLIFIHVVRAHVAARTPASMGLIAALGDDRIALALRLMHGSPAKAWTVRDSAAQSGLSRTAFATRFSATLGVGPATYLAKWRMSLAERELRATSRPISSIAHSIGFASASAFGAAFRSRFGVAPKLYRREAGSRTLDCGGRD